jgi:hypothetical protein
MECEKEGNALSLTTMRSAETSGRMYVPLTEIQRPVDEADLEVSLYSFKQVKFELTRHM